jgi:hypothetical protein
MFISLCMVLHVISPTYLYHVHDIIITGIIDVVIMVKLKRNFVKFPVPHHSNRNEGG